MKAMAERHWRTRLVPVRVDLDGRLLIPDEALDGRRLAVDFWALWCEECGTVVSEPVVGSHGVQTRGALRHDAGALTAFYTRMHVRALAAGIQPLDMLHVYRVGWRAVAAREGWLDEA